MKEKIILEYTKLENFNKKIVILTIALLIYGYLCRIVNLYFFWESKTLGWILLFISAILILKQRIKENKTQNKKTLSEKIFIGIAVFILLIQAIIFSVTPRTNAYKSAKEYLFTDSQIISKVGQVKDVFLKPTGGMSISSGSEGERGQADLNFIVKGAKKYIDVNLQLEKELNTNWTITEIK
jgi:uncharacterized protein with PQ loop repeat